MDVENPCPFCRIAETRPDWALFGDSGIMSFKPFGAVNPRHRLFVPVEHVVDAAEAPTVTGLAFEAAAAWGRGKGEPFNLVVNSGAPAGQTVFHLHVHYVPRAHGDGLGYRWRNS